MTINERVKDVRKAKGLTMEQFGDRLGVTKATISRIESGSNALTESMLKSVVREFRVSEDWLRTGEGDMQTPTARIDGVRRMVDDIASNSESFKARLISALSDLPVEDWEKIESFARQIVSEDSDELLAAHTREGFTADSPEALADIEMIKRIDSGETD